MGCGYSKISITGKRGRLKENSELGDDSPEDYYVGCSTPEKLRRANGKSSTNDLAKNNGVANPIGDESLASRRRIANKIKPISGPMRPPINRSDSQMDFFRMLDEKIENGKDFEGMITEDETTHVGASQVVLPGKSAQLISVATVADASCSSTPAAGGATVVAAKGRHPASGKENSRLPTKESLDATKSVSASHKRVRDESAADAGDPLTTNGITKATKFGPHAGNGTVVRGIQHAADSRPPAGAVASPTFANSAAKMRASPPRPDSSTSSASTTTSSALANEDVGQTYHVQAECHAHHASASITPSSSRDDDSHRPSLGAALVASSQLSMDVDLAADCMTDAAISAAIGEGGGIRSPLSPTQVAHLSSAIIEHEEEENGGAKDGQEDAKLCNSGGAVALANGGLYGGKPGQNTVS